MFSGEALLGSNVAQVEWMVCMVLIRYGEKGKGCAHTAKQGLKRDEDCLDAVHCRPLVLFHRRMQLGAVPIIGTDEAD